MDTTIEFESHDEARAFFTGQPILGGTACAVSQMPASIASARNMAADAISRGDAFVMDMLANRPATLNEADNLYATFDVSGKGCQSAAVVRVTTTQRTADNGHTDRFISEATAFVFPMSYDPESAVALIRDRTGMAHINPMIIDSLEDKLS